MLTSIAAISVGAAFGAVLRWLLSLAMNALVPALPLGTLAANLIAAYVVGLAIAYFGANPAIPVAWRLLIVTGFAGGLSGISGDLGLVVRTCFVFAFVLMFAAVLVPLDQIRALTWRNALWLGLSGVTTAGSWIFYYKAIKLGEVSTVALIDKGSVVVAWLLAWLLLGETLSPAKVIGGGMMVGGLLIIARG